MEKASEQFVKLILQVFLHGTIDNGAVGEKSPEEQE